MDEEVSAGRFDPPVDPDELATAVVRIGEAHIYPDLITGSEPEIAGAGRMIRLLLGAAKG